MNVELRTDDKGYVHAPPGPGLGVRVDWDAVGSATQATLEQTRQGLRVSGKS